MLSDFFFVLFVIITVLQLGGGGGGGGGGVIKMIGVLARLCRPAWKDCCEHACIPLECVMIMYVLCWHKVPHMP